MDEAEKNATLSSVGSTTSWGSSSPSSPRRSTGCSRSLRSPPPPRPPSRAVLCCSAEDPLDYQVDVCPRSWFRLESPSGVGVVAWKCCFVMCCLPLCYPCYLTRQFRRRGERVDDDKELDDGVAVVKAHKKKNSAASSVIVKQVAVKKKEEAHDAHDGDPAEAGDDGNGNNLVLHKL